MPYHAYRGHTSNTYAYHARAYAAGGGRCAGKGVPGQQPTTFAQCIGSGADPACCVAAAAHHNAGINNPDTACGMKGYYMNNCCGCGQPECSGGNTYPTGSVKPGQAGYSCGQGTAAAAATPPAATAATPADTTAAAPSTGGGSSILATLKQHWIIVAAVVIVLVLVMRR